MTKKTETKDPELFGMGDIKATEAALRKAADKPPAKHKPAARKQEVAKVEPLPPPAPRSLLEVIMAAVRDPACDVDKMKALLDMQEHIEERDAKKAFTRAFNALQAELPVIDKDGKIDHGEGTTARGNKKLKTRFATYPNIMNICGPLLKKHGFTLSNVIEPSGDGTRINVVGYLEHVEGHSRVSRFPLGIDSTGGKNNLQGWGSSQAYGQRYNAIALLNIVTKAPEDQDNDGFKKSEETEPAAPAMISKAQAEELRLAIEDAELPEERFLKGYGIEAVEELPANMLAQAKKDIAAFKRKNAEGRKNG